MNETCEVCGGTGVVYVLVNYSGFNYDADEPVYEKQSCEYCINGVAQAENAAKERVLEVFNGQSK